MHCHKSDNDRFLPCYFLCRFQALLAAEASSAEIVEEAFYYFTRLRRHVAHLAVSFCYPLSRGH